MNAKSTPPPEDVELDEILSNIRFAWLKEKHWQINPINTDDSQVLGVDIILKEAKQALLRWREAYADKLVKEAEIQSIISEHHLMRSMPMGDVITWSDRRLNALEDKLSALRKQQGDK